MAYDAPKDDTNSLCDEAALLLEMRRRSYMVFARKLAQASPKPMPDWVSALIAIWSLESLR